MPLTLTRKIGEVIEIIDPDGELLGTVTLKDVTRGSARLALEFPQDHRIARAESGRAREARKTNKRNHGGTNEDRATES